MYFTTLSTIYSCIRKDDSAFYYLNRIISEAKDTFDISIANINKAHLFLLEKDSVRACKAYHKARQYGNPNDKRFDYCSRQ